MLAKLFLILSIVVAHFSVFGQSLQSFHQIRFPADSVFKFHDKYPYPASIKVIMKDSTINTFKYHVTSNQITVNNKTKDSVIISFYEIIFPVGKNRPIPVYLSNSISANNTDVKKDYWGELKKSGSLGRGISVGNNQNATIQSGLNLQMDGKINEKVSLQAALTDRSAPFQSDGTTRRTQDFDRVFIGLTLPTSKIELGGLDLENDSNYFLKVNRNINGTRFTHQFYSPKANWKTMCGVGINRGKFARNNFMGQEGVQGPYRLQGSENETFVVVLANSEKVYLDGVLLKRGQDFDYVMDYNSAEIRFTPQHLITNQSRIIIEFEYLNQVYLRFNSQASIQITQHKTQWYWQHYAEMDQKNQFLQGTMDSLALITLSMAGNRPNDAYYSSIQSTHFRNDLVIYRLMDTLGFKNILVVSTDSSQQLYQAQFSFVGVGNGDYMPVKNFQNGKAYEWVSPNIVGPDTVHLGSYLPIIHPTAPQSKSMETFGGKGQFGKWNWNQEFAVSQFNANTFANHSSSTRTTWASKSNIFRTDTFKFNQKILLFKNGYSQEYLSNDFQIFQPYRNVEFAREWNQINQYSGKQELLQKIYSEINMNQHQMLDAQFQRWGINHQEVDSRKFGMNWRGIYKKISWESRGEQTIQKQNESIIGFSERYFGKILLNGLSRKSWIPQIQFIGNQEKAQTTRNALPFIPYSFQEWSSKASWSMKQKDFYLMAGSRWDVMPGNSDFHFTQKAQQISGGWNANQWKSQIQARNIHYLDSNLSDWSISLQTDGSFQWFHGAVQGQFYQNSGSAKTPKRDFTFLPVAPGLGTHQWNDYNKNGLQELNEFELAVFTDSARYVKILLPSNQYLNVFQSKSNGQITIQPGLIFSKNWMKSIYYSAQWNQDQQILKSVGIFSLIPQWKISNWDQVPGYQSTKRQTLWINRNHPKWGLEINEMISGWGQWNTNGLENRNAHEYRFQCRWVPYHNWLTTLKGGSIRVKQSSQLFLNRTFEYEGIDVGFSTQYQLNSGSKVMIESKKVNKHGYMSDLETWDSKCEIWINDEQRGQFKAGIQYTKNNFTGDARSPMSFEWMQGFQPGWNQSWNLGWNKNLKNNLMAQIQYQGRKLGEQNRIVHLLQMQLRYVF